VKEYLPTEIPREWIEELLDAAHWAPNDKLTPSLAFPRVLRRRARALGRSPTGGGTLGRRRKGGAGERRRSHFARAKCFSSPVVLIVSMVGDEKITDQENYAACWCAIENLLVAATARGLGSYPSRATGSTKTSLGQFSDSQRKSGWWRAFLGVLRAQTMAKRLPVERHTTWYTEA